MSRHSLVIVSNRLPVSVSREGGKLVFESSTGGLATAMSSLEQEDRVWVGWPGIASDNLAAAERREITQKLIEYDCVPVFLSQEQINLYYEGYSNDTLWPLFHYFQSVATYDDAYWNQYKAVNLVFAEVVEKCAAPDALVWVHDYQLMVLPKLLREMSPELSIGFFLHIPFPSFEIFRMLPERKEILEGLLGSDLIGFHIFDYSRHFLSSCMRLLGVASHGGVLQYDNRQVKVGVYPIGIDYEKFRKELLTKETKRALAGLNESYSNQKLIISVDRLDYSKGIPERLEAFRLLLEEHPEYHGNIKLLMVAVPSRTGVEAYKQLREQIEQTVSRINGVYSTVDWTPISYQFQNRPFSEVVALYARADIALVTPIRDGMNLVAKEYIASKNKKPGVLILSEMTGAIDELTEALSINPNNTRSITDAINVALKMSKREQLRRLTTMQQRLKVSTVQRWGNDFMRDLETATGQHDQLLKKIMTDTQRDNVRLRFMQASSRLVILDYDGTLKNFVSKPTTLAAMPSLKLWRTLKRLSEQPNTTVAIVSGRPRKALRRWFKGLDIVLAAEHGAWTYYDKTWQHTDHNFAPHKKKLKKILEEYVERTAGAEIEEKDYALVWHYINVVPELAYIRAGEIRRRLVNEITSNDIGVYSGNNIIEIKPTSVSKAHVASELMRRYPSEFVLCAGDDYTDEDMFSELGDNASTIKVGSGETRARYQLAQVSQMVSLLESFLEPTRRFTDRIKKLRR